MEYIATFDLGTTAIKGVLVSEEWKLEGRWSQPIETLFTKYGNEQSALEWYEGFCTIAREMCASVPPEQITGIVMSGQMQDVILLDDQAMPVTEAVLYSDGRGEKQADELLKNDDCRGLTQVTGNQFDGSIPFAKLLWFAQQQPELLQQARHVVFSSKDAVIARLCHEFVTDVTTGATTGLMDLERREWRRDWMQAAGLDHCLLPRLGYAHQKAGAVHEKAAAETGFAQGTSVFIGTGDAGATTLASGISRPGEYNINLGTSGWVATLSNKGLEEQGVFNLAAMPPGWVINVVPFLNAGNVHKWASTVLAGEGREKEKYLYSDALLEESQPGSHGLFCLPYLVGERFPVMDSKIRGAYVGLTPETNSHDLMRAPLEGIAFSIRQGIEQLAEKPVGISVIGGGGQTKVWCQILADVLDYPIEVYKNSEYAPAFAIAAAALIGMGKMKDYSALRDILTKG